MNTASRPPIHAAAAPSDAGVPKSANERAASAVTVTGLIFANACSQCGMVETGTNTELAKTSGKITTNPAVCAASAPRTVSATKAKIQLRAKPKAATTTGDCGPSHDREPEWITQLALVRAMADVVQERGRGGRRPGGCRDTRRNGATRSPTPPSGGDRVGQAA